MIIAIIMIIAIMIIVVLDLEFKYVIKKELLMAIKITTKIRAMINIAIIIKN